MLEKIIFITTNKAKLAQIRFIVEHFKFPVEILSSTEAFGEKVTYDEIGETVDQVALNGAVTIANIFNVPAITEDTDFRVEALNGEPGIRAGEFLKSFGRAEILNKMTGVKNRNAVITSAVGYATPTGIGKTFINKVEGVVAFEEKFGDFPDWIAPNPDNTFGGGYNAIFIPNGYDKTLAEISPEEAIPWSYREKNFIDVIKYILEKK